MRTTRHALVQQQRRGISEELLSLVLEHGKTHKATGHATMYRISKRELLFVKHDCPKPLWRRYRDSITKAVPVVADGETIITAMHRRERIRNLK
ncbi:MAG: hypothetical protein K0S79_170 [Nitrospira sp.]|jgi:hypothetical protein|nr:hypothetical protein [Nitrospira sp.]